MLFNQLHTHTIAKMTFNVSRLSDDDIDRIALRVRAILFPEMKSMIDAGSRDLQKSTALKLGI